MQKGLNRGGLGRVSDTKETGAEQGIVFKGPVYRTEKNRGTELDRTAVRSFFRLRLPAFRVSPVAGCVDL
jgi:hypothetical protein